MVRNNPHAKLIAALKKVTPLFVSVGGFPNIDTNRPYVLLTSEQRDEIVAALETLPARGTPFRSTV